MTDIFANLGIPCLVAGDAPRKRGAAPDGLAAAVAAALADGARIDAAILPEGAQATLPQRGRIGAATGRRGDDVPVYAVSYPRCIEDAAYLHHRLASLLRRHDVGHERFLRAHRAAAARTAPLPAARFGSAPAEGAPATPRRGGAMDAYLSPLAFAWPDLIEPSAWLEHAPFASWLAGALRPRRFVELGTHRGYSYFAVCQAVTTLGLDTRCHAVDTWQGDEHAGFYGEEVYERVAAHNAERYAGFSELVRTTFDEALDRFADGTIDLLHIDGRHFFDDVRNDFQSWRCKLSRRAVVLFHDTNVRDRGFGVHRLWAQIADAFPSFEFKHGHGLGVLGHGAELPRDVAAFFEAAAAPGAAEEIRTVYQRLGAAMKAEVAHRDETARLAAQAAASGIDAQKAAARAADLEGRLREAETAGRDAAARAADLEGRLREAESAGRDTAAKAERLAQEVAAGRAAAQELHAEIALRDHVARSLAGQRDATAAVAARLRDRIAEQDAALAGFATSTSWRITAPLRRASRLAAWSGRNGRRTLKLCWWLGTGRFRHAWTASSPYRRRARDIAARLLPVAAPQPAQLPVPAPAPPEADPHPDPAYAEWIARNDTLDKADRLLIREHIETFVRRPRFSIIMPVYNPPPEFLREALDSVLAQLYEDWELCIADDASPAPEVRALLEDAARRDPRIRVTFRPANGGISAASNTALDMATGDWVVLMDHDDTLSEHALYLVAEAIGRDPGAAIVYSDEDHIDAKGRRSGHYFKPDWDYDLFLGQNLINHLGAYRADLARKVGGFREGYDGSQDWDFALRVLEAEADARVLHVPFVLYHWRQFDRTFSQTRLAGALDSARRAVADHLQRTGQRADVSPQGRSSHLRVRRELPPVRPLVSIVIPTRDHCALLRACIDGLVTRTDYEPLEIVVVDNGSRDADALAFLAEIQTWDGVTVIVDPGAFNYSRLVNLGVAASSGEICVLLNNDIDVIHSDWLDELVGHVLRPDVGAVGAKLYYPDDTLQHGGVALGLGGTAGHTHRFARRDAGGYANRLNLVHSLSCVTGACLATRRDIYDSLGGLNEQDLSVSFNDVDFCIRLRQAGHRIVWTPYAELYHRESVSRGHDTTPEKAVRNQREQAYIRKKWGAILDNDPFFNPNLNLHSSDISLERTTRAVKPWHHFEWRSGSTISELVAHALMSAATARMSLSVALRLRRMNRYKWEIANHANARKLRVALDRPAPRIAVYTAIVGNYDSIKLPDTLDPRLDYILFSDTPVPDTGAFLVRPITYFSDDPTRAARYVKTHPHMLLQGYDVAVWLDASAMIIGDIHPLIERFLASGKAVGAIPHPMRRTVSEEIEACIHHRRDDPEAIRQQADARDVAAFEDDGLIESNLLVFDLRHARTGRMLDAWWTEIDRHSKRDQLSLPYVLAKTGTDWHRLMQRPNSLRNHPDFAFVPHGRAAGPEKAIVDALKVPLVDPYQGPAFAEVREERISRHRDRRIDIVVCVHNAYDDVERCLESLRRHRVSPAQRLILIDDGSDAPTAQLLADFARGTDWVALHRNERALRYTRAANRGLAAATGELVILLNSDVIVTDGWAEKMADAVFSTPGAGIVGPLSNAASHQSIPDHLGTAEQTAINGLVPGVTAENMNRYCERWTTADVLPRVPLVHGFCFGLTREAIERVGSFDAENFPSGYGEENDYCIRAADAGVGLVIATHTYVFHAKSKSYPDATRIALLRDGAEALSRLHGTPRIARAARSMVGHPMLEELRKHSRAFTAAWYEQSATCLSNGAGDRSAGART